MYQLRKSDERGHANHGWLDTRHTFSFAGYHDPAHMQFSDLRVINEDWIAPAAGFPTHPHQDMEIITFVVSGELKHRDSMGNGSVIRPGEIQRMSAGRGITHSEYNGSDTNPLHLLQIWIHTGRPGIEPGYEQKSYLDFRRENDLTLIASRGGEEHSVHINQDVRLYTADLRQGQRIDYQVQGNRDSWLQLISGELDIAGHQLQAGDGLGVSKEPGFDIEAVADSEFLLFDLRPAP